MLLFSLEHLSQSQAFTVGKHVLQFTAKTGIGRFMYMVSTPDAICREGFASPGIESSC